MTLLANNFDPNLTENLCWKLLKIVNDKAPHYKTDLSTVIQER